MWLGNPYRHTVLNCSMKMYLKVIGVVHVILAFLVLLLLPELLRRWLLVLVLGSSDGSTSTHEHMAKTMHNNKHTSKH